MRLKKLGDQVIVITGASSGIGLATARLAVQRGARVVMTARNEEALARSAELLRSEGGRVTTLAADVADERSMSLVAEHAAATFGGIDTWINNAGVAIYGRVEDVPLEDMRRLFDVSFWGVVNGTRAALPYLKKSSGALINMGSVESEVALPMQSAYAAAKHAVKAFTDVVRLELEKDGANVAVTLVKPSAIDTPFFEHAGNYMEGDPKPPPPVYAPEVVARAILQCAEHPVRDLIVGGSGRVQVGLARVTPRLSDRLLRATMFHGQQRSPRLGRDREGSLYRPAGSYGLTRGDYAGRVLRSSVYTRIAARPARAAAVALSTGAALVGVMLWMRSS